MGVLLFCFAANLLIVAALMPDLVRALRVTTQDVSLLITVYAMLSAAFNLVADPLSDRLGRRRILAVAALAFGVTTVGCGLAPDFASLFVMRALNGISVAAIGGGTYAYLADCVAKERAASAIGIASACLYLGTAGGVPLVVHVAHAWSVQAAFLVLGLPSIVAAAGIWFALPEVPTGAGPTAGLLRGYLDALQAPASRALLLFSFLSFAAGYALNAFLVAWMERALSIEPSRGALAFLAGGVCSFGVSVSWAKVLKDMGSKVALVLASMVAATAHVLIPSSTALWHVMAGYAVVSFAFTLRLVALQTLVAQVPAHQRGLYNSLFTASTQIGMALGPMAAGALLARHSFDTTAGGFTAMNLLAAGAILLSLAWLRPLLRLAQAPTSPPIR
ncbi:MFS transporter [Aquabacterium sp. A7-Y]|uniref:MFS transporter n=1 Tax=Aquabacterium sp. A7-Y TaxID=1349605 RepID=UPI00223E8C4E|nr:MFS transporter [Aquabacterium sp. A7-Y]MCW7541068.1 MFS transporter [Aquabacterium sp. A7-Y]